MKDIRPNPAAPTGSAVVMWLESVLLGLQSSRDEDWEGQIQTVESCIAELKRLHQTQTAGRQSAAGLDRAMLNLRAMLIAMRQRDPLTAADTGKAACAALSQIAGVSGPQRRIQ